MTELLILTGLALMVTVWFESLRLRESVISRCKQVCRESRLQLLDQTVALVSLSVRKSAGGSPHLYRKYQFEVSQDGTDRYPGHVEVLGRRIISISHDTPDAARVFLQYDRPVIH